MATVEKISVALPPEMVALVHNLGLLKANKGEIEAAIALYEQSLALTEQIGD